MATFTGQKMKSAIKDFFSKCDQIRSFLRIWSHLLKKSLMENFIFCAVFNLQKISIVIGAGKTYTMLGTDHEPGIMVLTLNDLYKQMDSSKNNLKFTVKMSYLEVSLAIIFYHSQIMENKNNFNCCIPGTFLCNILQ